jgi:hypothetical protein
MLKLHHKLKPLVSRLTDNEKRVFNTLCQQYHLVYFGTLGRDRDEDATIRGATLSATSNDQNFCVGTIYSHDVIFLTRSDRLKQLENFSGRFPSDLPDTEQSSSNSAALIKWCILQIDLKRHDLNHVIIDGRRQPKAHYDRLLINYPRLRPVDPLIINSPIFTSKFEAYSSLDTAIETMNIIVRVSDQLSHNFSQFDYEWFQDRLIIYAPTDHISLNLLNAMLQVGFYLAEQLENN